MDRPLRSSPAVLVLLPERLHEALVDDDPLSLGGFWCPEVVRVLHVGHRAGNVPHGGLDQSFGGSWGVWMCVDLGGNVHGGSPLAGEKAGPPSRFSRRA